MLPHTLSAVILHAWLAQAVAAGAQQRTVRITQHSTAPTITPTATPFPTSFPPDHIGWAEQTTKLITEVKTSVYDVYHSAPPPAKTMTPAVRPGIDQDDPKHLIAETRASLEFLEDAMARVMQQFASIGTEKSKHPIVQLEKTRFIKSMTCTNTKATLVFTEKTAYDVAYHDWQNHHNIVLVSYNPECGSGHDTSERDFLLAKDFRPDNKTLTITAEVEFVDLITALGEDTEIRVQVGTHTPTQPSKVKRGIFDNPFDAIQSKVDSVKSDIQAGASAVQSKGDDIASQAKATAEAAKTAVESKAEDLKSQAEDKVEVSTGFATTYTVAMDASESGVPEPWVDGHELLNVAGMRLDCVDCSANSTIAITASFAFSGVKGVTSANVGLSGQMGTKLQFGLDAKQGIEKRIDLANVTVVQLGIPALTIPNILNLGPNIKVDVAGGLNVGAEGSILMGAELNWPDFKFSADGIDTDHFETNGLAPDFRALHDVNGSVEASLDLSVPISVGVGAKFQIPKFSAVSFDKELSLTNTLGFLFGANISDEKPCIGTDLFIDLHDEVDLDVFQVYQTNLFQTTTTLFETCLRTSTSSTITSTATSMPKYVSVAAAATRDVSFPSMTPTGSEGVQYSGVFGSGSGSGSALSGATGTMVRSAFATGTGAAEKQMYTDYATASSGSRSLTPSGSDGIRYTRGSGTGTGSGLTRASTASVSSQSNFPSLIPSGSAGIDFAQGKGSSILSGSAPKIAGPTDARRASTEGPASLPAQLSTHTSRPSVSVAMGHGPEAASAY